MHPRKIVVIVFFATIGIAVGWSTYQRLHVWRTASEREILAKTEYRTRFWMQKTATIERNDTAMFYLSVGSVVSILFAVVAGVMTLTTGKHRAMVRRASVFDAHIGRSKVPVHYDDLKRMGPVYAGLTAAEQMYQSNAGQADGLHYYREFAEISKTMAQAQAILPQHAPSQTAAMLPPGQTPTFADLLGSETLAPGKPMILGFHQGQPEYRTLQNLKSVAVAGWQGSGKTSSAAFLVASCVLAYDVHAYVIDPHKQHDEGLYALIQPLEQTGRVTVVNPFDTPTLIRTLTQRLERRLRGDESSERGIVLVIDELARLAKMDCFDDLVIFIERCTEETRKANITFMGISTKWTARHFKGRADIRGCMNSALVHKCKPSQAELLLEDPKDKKLLEQLQHPGDAILLTDYAGAKPVSMPYCTRTDMTTVARMLAEATPRERGTRPIVLATATDRERSRANASPAETPLETADRKLHPACGACPETPAETRLSSAFETGETPTFGEIVRGRLATIQMSDGKPLSQNKLAELTGISKKDMSLYLNGGKPVSDVIRTQIERALTMIAKQGNTLQNQEETDAETTTETLLETLTPETALVH